MIPETLFDIPAETGSFEEFDKLNPQVWRMFARQALQAIKCGFKHYSARTIIEYMRHNTNIETTDPEFKLNNNFVPYYARKFHREYPQYDGFFEIRRRR